MSPVLGFAPCLFLPRVLQQAVWVLPSCNTCREQFEKHSKVSINVVAPHHLSSPVCGEQRTALISSSKSSLGGAVCSPQDERFRSAAECS